MHNKQEGSDNFEQHIISNFHGYVSSADLTNIKPNILVRGSQNVYKKLSGTIANRPGRKQYDAVDNTLAGVKSAYVWYTSKGAVLPLRIANSLFQVYSTVTGTGVWYTLQSSVTLTRYIFETVWDGTLLKDFLVFVRGSTDLFRWDGGIGLFSSGTINTIVLTADAATSGFPTSGTVTIGGNTYTYSGISGSTLTGVNATSVGEVANSVVLLSVVTNATTPASTFTNDFVRVNNNHLGVGSNTSRKFYISKDTNYIDYSQATPRIPGDGAQPFFDSNLVGAIVKGGDYWISGGTSDWYQVKFVQSVNSSGVQVESLEIKKQPTPSLAGAYSHEFMTIVNDTIVYLSKDQQLRTIGLYRNLNQPAYPSLSQEIAIELSGEDFTLGHIRAIKDFIYLVAPNAGRVYLHQTRSNVDPSGNVISERLWHSPFIWGISHIDEISGTVVGFSNSNPQLYSLWDTGQWHDDAPDTSAVLSLPYTSVMLLAYQNGGRRQGKINFDKMYYEGYAVGTLYDATYYDYQGATKILSSILNNPQRPFQKTYIGQVPPSLGGASLGDNPLGTGLSTSSDDQDLLPKFRVIVGKEAVDCFEFAPMVYSDEVDSRWEMLALGANITLSTAQAIEIIRRRANVV